jgi:hypothetical protein
MRIHLAPEIQVIHLKRWTLWSMLRTDVVGRGVPWMRLLIQRRSASASLGDLNLKAPAIASIPLAWGAVLALLTVPWLPRLIWLLPLFLVTIVVLNWRTYDFFRRVRGTRFMLAATALHFVYHLCNGVSAVAGALSSVRMQSPPRTGPAPGERQCGAELRHER